MDEMERYLEQFEQLLDDSFLTGMINMGISMLFAIPAFIFMAIALYCMARRRGIYHTWTAWIPVANAWMVGCLSDQYRAVALNQRSNRRKTLLWLNVARIVLTVLVTAFAAILLTRLWNMGLLKNLDDLEELSRLDEAAFLAIMDQIAVPLVCLLFLSMPMLALTAVYYVFFYKSLADIYKSSIPQRARLFMILTLAVGLLANFDLGLPLLVMPAIFLFTCRNMDRGMPLREPIPEAIMETAPEAMPEPEPEVYCLPQAEPVEEPVAESEEASVAEPGEEA